MRTTGRVVRMFALATALAATATACGSSAQAGSAPSRTSTPPPPYRLELIGNPAPDFTLRDQFDRQHRLSDFRGEVVLLTFVSTRCKDICPLTAELLAQTQDDLGTSSDDVQVVAVNANYVHSSIHDVFAWSKDHSMLHRWLFLTSQAATLWTIYHAYGVTPGAAHTVLVFVIDPKGRLRAAVPIAMEKGLDAEAAVLAKSVDQLQGTTS